MHLTEGNGERQCESQGWGEDERRGNRSTRRLLEEGFLEEAAQIQVNRGESQGVVGGRGQEAGMRGAPGFPHCHSEAGALFAEDQLRCPQVGPRWGAAGCLGGVLAHRGVEM